MSETVGWLDERAVTYGDIARYLRTKDPEAFSRSLEGLVLERVTRTEADALGVRVPDGLLASRTEARLKEWDRRVRQASREQGGEELEPAVWLQRIGGVSLGTFREWVRGHTEVEMLQDRLLRFEQLLSPRVEVSLLVLPDRAAAEQAASEARAGADFALLARERSVHASREQSGRIPFPVLPADLAVPSVREALFRAEPGAVLGPFESRAGDETFFQVYRLDARRSGREGSWSVLEKAVERDLSARPVHVGEYERWRRRILLRHGFVAAHAVGEPQ